MLLKITRIYLPIFFFLCRQGLFVYPWPRTHSSSCLCFPHAGIKVPPCLVFKKVFNTSVSKIFKVGFKKLNTKLENYSGNSSQRENNLGVVLSQV